MYADNVHQFCRTCVRPVQLLRIEPFKSTSRTSRTFCTFCTILYVSVRFVRYVLFPKHTRRKIETVGGKDLLDLIKPIELILTVHQCFFGFLSRNTVKTKMVTTLWYFVLV